MSNHNLQCITIIIIINIIYININNKIGLERGEGGFGNYFTITDDNKMNDYYESVPIMIGK